MIGGPFLSQQERGSATSRGEARAAAFPAPPPSLAPSTALLNPHTPLARHIEKEERENKARAGDVGHPRGGDASARPLRGERGRPLVGASGKKNEKKKGKMEPYRGEDDNVLGACDRNGEAWLAKFQPRPPPGFCAVIQSEASLTQVPFIGRGRWWVASEENCEGGSFFF